MSKRPISSPATTSSSPPAKRQQIRVQLDPIKLSVSSIEELDINVLQFQNKKLGERLQFCRKSTDEYRKRIEQLEQRQSRDDAVLCIINRYWNLLDEDVGVLLQRFDAQTADESEQEKEMKSITSFIAQLGEWDQQEMEDKLYQRVELSKRYIGKLLQAYDRLVQHHDKVWNAVRDEESSASLVKKYIESEKEKKESVEKLIKEDTEENKEESEIKSESPQEDKISEEDKVKIINDYVKEEMARLRIENIRLHEMVTDLHKRHHETKSRERAFIDKMSAAESEAAELKQKNDELEYDLSSANEQIYKLEGSLLDYKKRIMALQEGNSAVNVSKVETVNENELSTAKVAEEHQKELEEFKELASTRLAELEVLQLSYEKTVREKEKLRSDLTNIPETVIKESTDYKTLHSQYSVLYNESLQMMTKLEEAIRRTQTQYTQHQRQIEQMESEELKYQKQMRTEMMILEEQVCMVRKENENLKQQNEQFLANTDQLGPINREMRQLISQLRTLSEQQKVEIGRYRRRIKELQIRLNDLEKHCTFQMDSIKSENLVKDDNESLSTIASSITDDDLPTEKTTSHEILSTSLTESDVDLKCSLKNALDNNKELKMLLDAFKLASKDNRDKATLMASEKRAKEEIDELKEIVKKLEKEKQTSSAKPNEIDRNIKKIAYLEKQVHVLKNDLQAKEAQENALFQEMEVTGEALDETREQNCRLLNELKEKDDANINLMAERLKSQTLIRLIREEKKQLAEEVQILAQQLDAQNQVVRSLEEKERGLILTLSCCEKESLSKQLALEHHKRKAVESTQSAADLKLQVEKYQMQLKEAQLAVADKTTNLEHELFKHKRLKEEVALLRKKVERCKKIEQANSADQVLLEEIKEYKEQLTCPSCKVKKKDAVLTKCFHVFCLDCLKVRYETRQRKCPKCNAGFGAHDYHRLYLT